MLARAGALSYYSNQRDGRAARGKRLRRGATGMNAGLSGGTSRRGELVRWLMALAPAVPLLVTLVAGAGSHGMTLALQVLFTIAAGCHLLLAFHLVAKLRNRGAGMPAAGIGTSAIRVAISFVLFWVAFALALGLHDAPAGSAFPSIYAIYCGAMLALLLAAFFGAWLLGRLVRQRSQANPPTRRVI